MVSGMGFELNFSRQRIFVVFQFLLIIEISFFVKLLNFIEFILEAFVNFKIMFMFKIEETVAIS